MSLRTLKQLKKMYPELMEEHRKEVERLAEGIYVAPIDLAELKLAFPTLIEEHKEEILLGEGVDLAEKIFGMHDEHKDLPAGENVAAEPASENIEEKTAEELKQKTAENKDDNQQ